MSKWSWLKMAVLTASLSLPAFAVGGCLGANWYQRMIQYVTIGWLFN